MASGDSYDVFAAQVGDTITVAGAAGDRVEMTVWRIGEPLTAGRSAAAGPTVYAHIRPDGYAVSFDNDTKSVYDPRQA